MTSAAFYHIHTTVAATGQAHQSDYWPDGDGVSYAGYVTSMTQYCAELDDNLTPDNLLLYVVTSTGHTKQITDDDDLKQAVGSLPNRGVLSVTAIPSSRANSRNRRRDRRNKRSRRASSDDDGDSDEGWNARPNGTGTARKWYDQADSSSDEDETSDYSDGETVVEHSAKLKVVTGEKKVGAIMRRFHEHVTAADEDDDDVQDDAPEYPLYREEELWVRPEVCHLQYILTCLGFMPLNATKQLVGSYQSNTEDAVRRFRKHYGIRGGDMTVYDRRTAEKMGEVVRHFRQQGHKHI